VKHTPSFKDFSKPNKVIDAWKRYIAITSSSVVDEGWDLPSNRLPSTVIGIQ